MSRIYFISDVHLSPDLPRVSAGFLTLLTQIKGADALYVLGDLFESWVGDDHTDEFNTAIIAAFKTLSSADTALYFVHGNRDFLLGNAFAAACGGTLLAEDQVIDAYGEKILLMHGDQLCTRDEKYMAFRAQSRDPAWQAMMLEKPLDQRLMIAGMWRAQSKAMNANKAENIMDVSEDAVASALQAAQAHTLLHGHTHRPAVHTLMIGDKPAQRFVLGDWQEDTGSAVIGIADTQGLRLESWAF